MVKKVSIVVCTYNAKDDLRECLNSLECQDYHEKEIVVINDASTDGTLEFLQQFKGHTEQNIIIVSNEANLGVAGSRNVGIQHATGEIIAFTDADCVADARWISELVKIYECRNVAAVGGRILDARIDDIWKLSSRRLNFVAAEEGYVSYIQGCNMSFDGSILRQYLFNDELKYGYEETLLCDDLIEKGHKIYYNPGAVVHHKHKTDLCAILKQKYLRGVSSVWYRKKKNKLLMFKRHLILFFSILFIPFLVVNKIFLYLSLLLFMVFLLSLLRDEIDCRENNFMEILITFPFLVLIEFSHFIGSCAGLVKFRIMKTGLSS